VPGERLPVAQAPAPRTEGPLGDHAFFSRGTRPIR
jgi:hypothetical protein